MEQYHSHITPSRSLNASPFDPRWPRTSKWDDNASAPIEMHSIPGSSSTPEPKDSRTQSLLHKSIISPGIIKRLGSWVIFTIVAAICFMLLAISVLSFLWFPVGGDTNHNWRRIMIHGWNAQVITVSTLVIRSSVGVLAGAATAMFASLAIEGKQNGGIPLTKAAELSLARFEKPDPLMFLFPAWTSFKTNIALLLALVVLAVMTTASQFSSTLLFWDVGSRSVPGFSTNMTALFGFEMESYLTNDTRTTLEQSVDYWNAAPSRDYPAYAQWRTSAPDLPGHVKDTGPTIRGFLPIMSEAERTNVTQFDGKAALFDSRVACVRPRFLNYSFTTNTFEGRFVHGDLTEDLKKVFVSNSSDDPETMFKFSTNLGATAFDGASFQILTMPLEYGGLINSLDPTNNATLDHTWNFTNKKWTARDTRNSDFWTVELGHVSFFMRLQNGTDPGGLKNTTKERGVWMDFYEKDGYRMSVTACYDALYYAPSLDRIQHPQDFAIAASRQQGSAEPQLSWNSNKGTFDTSSISYQFFAAMDQQQLSAIYELDKPSLDAALEPYTSNWKPNAYFDYVDGPTSAESAVRWYNASAFNESRTPESSIETSDFLNTVPWRYMEALGNDIRHARIVGRCRSCWVAPQADNTVSYESDEGNVSIIRTTLHPIFTSLVNDILDKSDDPALAWQSLTTSVLRMAYYDWLQAFTANKSITTTSMVTSQAPIRNRGFFIVMSILLAHFVATVSAFAWFWSGTKYTLLGNAWQVVAQMKAPATERLLDQATMASDKTVRKLVEDNGNLKRRVRIAAQEEDDRVCLS